MTEVWEDIKDYEGVYQVSNFGRVRSLDHYASNGKVDILYKGKIRKTKIMPNGYEAVTINGKNIYIHRLVATTFLDNQDNLPQVNHKDENKLNNHVDNLEWCTQKYNMNYNGLHDRIGVKLRGLLINNIPIAQYTLEGAFIRKFNSAVEASKVLNIDNSLISKAVKGRVKHAGGYVWRKI